jgi:hypothetical protein
VGINPTTGSGEIPAHPVEPVGFFPTSQPSPAYSYNNLLTSLVEIPVSEVSEEREVPPKVPRKRQADGPTKPEIAEAFTAYNATAERCGIPRANKLTADRETKIKARLKDHGLDGWMTALGIIEQSAFLCGENDRGWRIHLDWMLEPRHFNKVIDGIYGNGRHTGANPSKQTENPTERRRRLLAQISAEEGKR